jgi:hypothetical protein
MKFEQEKLEKEKESSPSIVTSEKAIVEKHGHFEIKSENRRRNTKILNDTREIWII